MIKSYSCFLIHYIYTSHAIFVKLDDVRDCSHMPPARGGGGIQNLTKTDLKIRKEGGSRSLNYVSTCQSLIFRYCHNLDAKHVTTLNRGAREGGEWVGIWLLIVFSFLYYPSFSFIPIPLKDKDVKWKFSQLLHQRLCLFENSTLLYQWMVEMCNFLHDCIIICFYWLNTSRKTLDE